MLFYDISCKYTNNTSIRQIFPTFSSFPLILKTQNNQDFSNVVQQEVDRIVILLQLFNSLVKCLVRGRMAMSIIACNL